MNNQEHILQLKNLSISTEDNSIIKDFSLEIRSGEIHCIMGPNGSGKSSLANAIMGHPSYAISSGEIILDGQSLTLMSPDKRARAGLFLSMQHPPEIPGVTITHFLRIAYNALHNVTIPVMEFYNLLQAEMKALGIDPLFAQRYLNTGFSGGEKKRMEILQLSILRPKFAILDEIDSGLDVDALNIVATGIKKLKQDYNLGVIVITHYSRLLDYLVPDKIHILQKGRLIKTGTASLAKEIELTGYNQ